MAAWILAVLLISNIGLSWQSEDVAPPPELTLSDIEVEVDEEEHKRLNLYGDGNKIVTCSDEDPARAFIQFVSPSYPCGKRCFSLEPCANVSQDFCLFYLPGQGMLDFATTSKYTLTIGCTDDVEGVTTESLTVTVVPNTPPTFEGVPPSSASETIDKDTKVGEVIFEVKTHDIDNDPIYYTMSTDPRNDFLEIGHSDGKIRTTKDVRFFCEESITASVTATDGHNPSIGPLTIGFKLEDYNTAPVVKNLDTKITIDENIGANVSILEIFDATVYPKTNITMWSSSPSGLDMYKLGENNNLETRINPNYERKDTRSVTLYFEMHNGFCKSTTYSVTVEIRDVNEPVTYDRKFAIIDVYEEDIYIPTGLNVIDEDINDKHTHRRNSDSNRFGIDADSGDIYSLKDIDIDLEGGKARRKQTFNFTTQVTDKGGHNDTAKIMVRVWDANDNPPIFEGGPYTIGATECSRLGSIIGAVTGSDADSDHNQNNKFYYGGKGGKFTVMSNGSIVLTEACTAGQGSSGEATITDMGIYPGPLSGIPATITLQCSPCVTRTPATNAPATRTSTTKAPVTTTTITTTTITPGPTTTTSPGSSGGGFNPLLAWLIPAVLGGLIWLGLTALLIYRYCCPCRNPCAGRCRSRPKPSKVKPPPKTPKEPKPAKPKEVRKPPPPPPAKPATPPPTPPPPKPVTPPPPPPPPKPEPEPYLFGFWKEYYTDQDINAKQAPKVDKPVPIEKMPKGEAIAEAPANLKLGNPVTGYYGQHGPANTPNSAPSVNPTANGNASVA